MKKAGATKLIVQPSPCTYRQRERIVEAASKPLLVQATEIVQ